MQSLGYDYVFSPAENASLKGHFLDISVNPYKDYEGFEEEIGIICRALADTPFITYCARQRTYSSYEKPFVVLKNCPVDDNLPVLDFESPVTDKREKKKTYVSEAFLLFYAKAMGQQPIGYKNVNDGDVFQDIHPMRALAQSQSQKALEGIYFHKDLANHFVRPDWVNILGLRSSLENEVFTCFVRNKDVLEHLSAESIHILRQNEFYTPFDDLTVHGAGGEYGPAAEHPVIGGAADYDIRVFEKRTFGRTPSAQKALDELIALLHHFKRKMALRTGDFSGVANNESVHSRELGVINNREALKHRWMQKTVNVKDISAHSAFLLNDRKNIING